MSFLSNVVNSIPGVGHFKGLVHYAAGDNDKGHQAIYQSTRTMAVLGAGAVGCIAGPAGAAAGAMYAGMATDAVASLALREEQGFIRGVSNIADDIDAGRNPLGSIASTTLQVGLDGIGGLGMGSVSNAASNISEKAITKTMENVGKKIIGTSVGITTKQTAKTVTMKVSEKAAKRIIVEAAGRVEAALISTHIAARAAKKTEIKGRKWRGNEGKQTQSESTQQQEQRADDETQENSGNSGAPQPPHDNEDNNEKCKQNYEPSLFDTFMNLLKRLLKFIYGNQQEPFSAIFGNLRKDQRRYLVKAIKAIMVHNTLDVVVELVIKIFKNYLCGDLSFLNFLSLLEFVQTYVCNQVNVRNQISRGTATTRPQMTYNERQRQILLEISQQENIVEQLVELFNTLKAEIEVETFAPNNISPDFRDIFAAIYHYYKHKYDIPGRILSVKDYYNWIRKILEHIKKLPEYIGLTTSADGRTFLYEIPGEPSSMFRIVVRVCNGKIIVISACSVLYNLSIDDDS